MKNVPELKCIPRTGFIVDGFKFQNPSCRAYFLSHAHSDHYQGLTDKWSGGMIYCTDITSRFIQQILGVDKQYITELPMDLPINIHGVEVTLVDANHCPGAVQFIFKLSDGSVYLHCGDMRFCDEMKSNPHLIRCKSADAMYLDTTYCNPRHTFPIQPESTKYIAKTIKNYLDQQKSTYVFAIAAYNIGKEKIYEEVYKQCGLKMFTTERKLKMLKCLNLPNFDEMFTEDESSTPIILVDWQFLGETFPFFKPNYVNMEKYRVYMKADKFVGFVPSGQIFNAKKGPFQMISKGDCEVHLVPYSEHSSFTELREYVQFIKPKQIIPTVGASDENKALNMVKMLSDLVDQNGSKARFLQMFKKPNASNPNQQKQLSQSENQVITINTPEDYDVGASTQDEPCKKSNTNDADYKEVQVVELYTTLKSQENLGTNNEDKEDQQIFSKERNQNSDKKILNIDEIYVEKSANDDDDVIIVEEVPSRNNQIAQKIIIKDTNNNTKQNQLQQLNSFEKSKQQVHGKSKEKTNQEQNSKKVQEIVVGDPGNQQQIQNFSQNQVSGLKIIQPVPDIQMEEAQKVVLEVLGPEANQQAVELLTKNGGDIEKTINQFYDITRDTKVHNNSNKRKREKQITIMQAFQNSQPRKRIKKNSLSSLPENYQLELKQQKDVPDNDLQILSILDDGGIDENKDGQSISKSELNNCKQIQFGENLQQIYQANQVAHNQCFFSKQNEDENDQKTDQMNQLSGTGGDKSNNQQKQQQDTIKGNDSKEQIWVPNSPIPYLNLALTCEAMSNTTKNLKIAAILVDFFSNVIKYNKSELIAAVYLLCGKIAPDYAKVDLNVGGGSVVNAIIESLGVSRSRIREMYKQLGDLGDIAQECRQGQCTLIKPQILTIQGVFDKLIQISKEQGNGSVERRHRLMVRMLCATRKCETKFLVRTLISNLRLGAGWRTVIPALAKAVLFNQQTATNLSVELQSQVANEALEAFHLCPNLEILIPELLDNGPCNILQRIGLRAGIPIKPMLAQVCEGIPDAFKKLDSKTFRAEFKYDGIRAQVHVENNKQVSIYSRNCDEKSEAYPDVVELILKNLKCGSIIVDGELVAVDHQTGKFRAFQELSTRARVNVKIDDVTVDVCFFVFDCLYVDGESLLKKSFRERRQVLEQVLNWQSGKLEMAQGLEFEITEQEKCEIEVDSYLKESLAQGTEGLMLKRMDLRSSYQPSKRSESWLKIKKDYCVGMRDTLDLVPIGAWYGNGRKAGWFSPWLMAVWDPDSEQYQSICRVMDGFTDAFYKQATERFQQHIIPKPKSYYSTGESAAVWFDAVEVWELLGSEFSVSPVHKAGVDFVGNDKGLSLRFPRFIKVREDLFVEDATTAQQVADMFNGQTRKMNLSNN